MWSTVGVSEAVPASSLSSIFPELLKMVSKHSANPRLYEEQPAWKSIAPAPQSKVALIARKLRADPVASVMLISSKVAIGFIKQNIAAAYAIYCASTQNHGAIY